MGIGIGPGDYNLLNFVEAGQVIQPAATAGGIAPAAAVVIRVQELDRKTIRFLHLAGVIYLHYPRAGPGPAVAAHSLIPLRGIVLELAQKAE